MKDFAGNFKEKKPIEEIERRTTRFETIIDKLNEVIRRLNEQV